MLFLVVIGGLVAAGAVLHWKHYTESPIEGLEAGQAVVVEGGEGFSEVIGRLSDEGVITNPTYFKILVRVRKVDSRLRPGRYDLPKDSSPSDLLDRITRSGPGGTLRLTVPEGWTIFHIADRIEAEGLATRKDFLAAATDKKLMKDMGVRGPSFEGYLFPDTYFFDPGTSPKVIVRRMVRRHQQIWKKLSGELGEKKMAAHKKKYGLSNRELVVLASIVEREAVVAEERPIIARVFYNRMAIDMKLQTDPTCVYGAAIYKEKPSPKLCRKQKNPYSTYQIKGLPPGPIANPGRASIRAVLKPTTKASEVEYLYFVAKPGGRRHTFSKTYADHKKAIPR